MHTRVMANTDSQQSGRRARLGEALRARRKALGVSMATAAEAAGMSRTTWHRLERGETTVGVGALAEAARVLGLELALRDPATEANPADPPPGRELLPLQIRLGDYPQLRRLAWQIGNEATVLAPYEAMGLYERNWRHMDTEALSDEEAALIRALGKAFGNGLPDV